MRKKNPNKLLQKILKLIDSDLKQIEIISKNGQLPPQDAQTLCRYAAFLADEAKTDDKQEEKVKKELSNKPLEDLIKLYQDTKKDK